MFWLRRKPRTKRSNSEWSCRRNSGGSSAGLSRGWRGAAAAAGDRRGRNEAYVVVGTNGVGTNGVCPNIFYATKQLNFVNIFLLPDSNIDKIAYRQSFTKSAKVYPTHHKKHTHTHTSSSNVWLMMIRSRCVEWLFHSRTLEAATHRFLLSLQRNVDQ